MTLLRRSLILAPTLLVAPAIVRAARFRRVGGGTKVTVSFIQGLPDGSSPTSTPPSLPTPYGLITMGDYVSPVPGYGGGDFRYGLLNGVEMEPAAPVGVFGLPCWQRLYLVDFGAGAGPQIYGICNDQIYYGWQNYSWQTNDGVDLSTGPGATPIPPALPTYAPPYTPSAENTSISGGGGTLTTLAGVFSFGSSSGPSWQLKLNGIPIAADNNAPANYFFTDLMTVYGHGQLFCRRYSDATWRCWTGNQLNTSTGPTAAPVPVGMSLSPPRPQQPASSPVGTHLGTVSVTMSDGGSFGGTIAIGDTTNFAVSGSNINTAVSPFASSITSLSVTQNGTSYSKELIIVAL